MSVFCMKKSINHNLLKPWFIRLLKYGEHCRTSKFSEENTVHINGFGQTEVPLFE